MSDYRRTKAYERFSKYLSEIRGLDLSLRDGKIKAIDAAVDFYILF